LTIPRRHERDILFCQDEAKMQNVWNQSLLGLNFKRRHENLCQAHEGVIFPLSKDDRDRFVNVTLTTNKDMATTDNLDDILWNSFACTFGIVWSQTHWSTAPKTAPLADLFNGKADRVSWSKPSNLMKMRSSM